MCIPNYNAVGYLCSALESPLTLACHTRVCLMNDGQNIAMTYNDLHCYKLGQYRASHTQVLQLEYCMDGNIQIRTKFYVYNAANILFIELV